MGSFAKAILDIPVSAASYAAGIEGLTRIDERLLSEGGFRPLYQSGVVYKREPRDVWRHVGDVQGSGWGDCEDLAAWRAAELRVSGEDPGARVVVYQSGPRKFHAIVGRSDGTTEDPSRRLGMLPGGRSPMGTLEGDNMSAEKRNERRARRARARAMARYCVQNMRREPIGTSGAWIGIGEDPTPGDAPTVTFDLYRSGKGWSGIVRLPLAAMPGRPPGALVAKTSPTMPRDGSRAAERAAKAASAEKAVRLAAKISQIPGVQAIVPPQAQAALRVLNSPVGKLATKGAGRALRKLF